MRSCAIALNEEHERTRSNASPLMGLVQFIFWNLKSSNTSSGPIKTVQLRWTGEDLANLPPSPWLCLVRPSATCSSFRLPLTLSFRLLLIGSEREVLGHL